jgi:hypothetical protein
MEQAMDLVVGSEETIRRRKEESENRDISFPTTTKTSSTQKGSDQKRMNAKDLLYLEPKGEGMFNNFEVGSRSSSFCFWIFHLISSRLIIFSPQIHPSSLLVKLRLLPFQKQGQPFNGHKTQVSRRERERERDREVMWFMNLFSTAITARVKSFLPLMKKANEDLERQLAEDPSKKNTINIEHIEDDEKAVIEMVSERGRTGGKRKRKREGPE